MDTCDVSKLYYRSQGIGKVYSTINEAQTSIEHELKNDGQIRCLSTTGHIGQVRWAVKETDSAIFYGVAMEGEKGISLDNFSVRGSSGLHLRNIPLHILQEFHRVHPYDFIRRMCYDLHRKFPETRAYPFDGRNH